MIQLRDYQVDIASKAVQLLRAKKIAYLAMEVRTGKTFTALQAANDYGAKNVLFLTKKKAVESGTIQKDYESLSPDFKITITNNESLHKVTNNDFDLLISDEHHRNGSYPKPNKTTKEIKQRFGHLPMIFLSGTPAIESISQWYHQFWISNYTPFSRYSNFYNWYKSSNLLLLNFERNGFNVNDYTNNESKIQLYNSIKHRKLSKQDINYVEKKMLLDAEYFKMCIDAKNAENKILEIIEPYLLKYTQKEAGFTAEIEEHVIYYEMPDKLRKMAKTLLDDELIRGNTENIVANNAAAMMNKIHQIENGTVITEQNTAYIIDTSKAEFIKSYFKNKKIAIFYYFQKEKELLLQVFGDNITTDIHEFNSTDKNFAIQQITGSEAISLKEAEALVYYNFGYSGKNYTQGRDRMTTKERAENNIYFVLASKSINERIYKAIKAKKRYNEKLFLKDYKWQPKANCNQK